MESCCPCKHGKIIPTKQLDCLQYISHFLQMRTVLLFLRVLFMCTLFLCKHSQLRGARRSRNQASKFTLHKSQGFFQFTQHEGPLCMGPLCIYFWWRLGDQITMDSLSATMVTAHRCHLVIRSQWILSNASSSNASCPCRHAHMEAILFRISFTRSRVPPRCLPASQPGLGRHPHRVG